MFTRAPAQPRSVRRACERVFVEPLDHLADRITTLAAHLSAATARWLALIGEFDVREGWAESGCKSSAAWLSWSCGIAPLTAREHVRVARRLRELPLTAGAFSRGELSYSKVRALTRVQEVEDERELVSLARHATASQLERIVRGYRSVLAVEEDAERAYAERSLTWSWEDDGTLVLRGRLPGEHGALLVAALEAARETLGPPRLEAAPQPAFAAASAVPADARSGNRPEPVPTVPAETPANAETVAARSADALLALAEASLADRDHSTADRYQVVVHVDADALSQSANDSAAARCELDVGVPLAHAAARRLACDVSLVRIVERDGEPLSVGRRTRSIPPALRRALRSRDGGCVFPGCQQARHVDAHHLIHWADGGRTELANLIQVCRRHHRLLHEAGFVVRRLGGALAFFAPDGRRLAQVPRPPRGDHAAVLAANRRARVRVSAETPRSLDGGVRMDLPLAIDAMLQITRVRRE